MAKICYDCSINDKIKVQNEYIDTSSKQGNYLGQFSKKQKLENSLGLYYKPHSVGVYVVSKILQDRTLNSHFGVILLKWLFKLMQLLLLSLPTRNLHTHVILV